MTDAPQAPPHAETPITGSPLLVLIGFMGAGKSTLARMLSAELGCPLIDLDEEIARIHGTIPELFATRGESGFRGERLKVIDPGIVPERPSSPNLPLNVAVALLVGLVLPVLYFTLQMNYQERRASLARGGFRALGKARDE